jgi:hypothetical protein
MRWSVFTSMVLFTSTALAQDVSEAVEALDAVHQPTSSAADIDTSVSRLTQRLSVRDPEPDCDEVTSDLFDATAALRTVVATVQMPPWAPMRAAACLLSHPEVGRTDALDWLAHPNKRGLALLVMARLDGFPEALAVELGTAALRGPWSADAKRQLRSANNPRLRELVSLPETTTE